MTLVHIPETPIEPIRPLGVAYNLATLAAAGRLITGNVSPTKCPRLPCNIPSALHRAGLSVAAPW